MNHGQQHPIDTTDPNQTLRIMRASVLAQIEANRDQGAYLAKQLQAIDHLTGLINGDPPAPQDSGSVNYDKEAITQAAMRYADVRGGPSRMADELNKRGVTTKRNKRWTALSARRAILDAKELGDL